MHKFFDMSIKKKFIVIMILASILPMAVFGVYAYTTSTRSLELQTQNSATQALSRSWLYLDLSLQQVFDYANNLAKDYRIIEALKNVTNDGADATINSQIWSMKKEIRIPLKVLIISKDSRWFSDYETDSSKISDAVDTIKNEQWYKNRDIFNFQTVFLGVKKNYVKDFETDSHLYLYRSIVSDTGEFLGIVLLDINSYTFDRLLSSSINRTSDLMYLVDDKNCIVSFSDENIDGVDKYGKNISEYLGFNPISDVFNNRYIIQNTKLTNENWTILYFINKQSIYNETRKIEFFAIGIICILVVMEFLLYLFVNRSITNPITMMAKAMKKVQNSDFEIVLEAKTSDEIGVLSIGFNKMVAEIKNLIDKIRYEEKQLRNLEFSMLQAQIKPHFLYNSLNGIKLLAEMEGRDNISKSITALIKLLQYSIGSIEETLTLCKEVEYLESYIFLNNIRFKNKFDFKVNIPEKYDNFRLFKFIIQPFVENSIIHGFKEKPGMGLITLSLQEFNENISLVVEDNGWGMTFEALEEVLNKCSLENNTGEIAHFGIQNVNRRLKLLYGDDFGIQIRSVPGKGTKIFIIIPINEMRC